jgi:phage N-6-adenine-methyltransferase
MAKPQPTPDILGDLLGRDLTKTQTINMNAVRIDGGTQMRAGLDEPTVKEYVDTLYAQERLSNWPFPPIVVFYDGQDHWLGDGFHRLEAVKRLLKGDTVHEIPADIRAGTRRDAVLHAAQANANHGLRRSQADKRRAVETLLRDDEWSQWSDREIARRCNVSADLVGVVRKELAPPVTVNSDSETTSTRTFVTKHGTTATMQVGNINGQRQPSYAPVWKIEQTVSAVLRKQWPDVPPTQMNIDDMRDAARKPGSALMMLCETALDEADIEFRRQDLVQAINNVAAQLQQDLRQQLIRSITVPIKLVSSNNMPYADSQAQPPAADGKLLVDYTDEDWNLARRRARDKDARGGLTKAEYALTLVPQVVAWLRTYKDRYGRTWQQIEDVGAHSNSTHWSDITAEWQRRGSYFDDDVLKEAIKTAFQWLQEEAVTVGIDSEPTPADATETPVSLRDGYDSDEWYTPDEIIRTAHHVMGSIDLDPATCELAQTVVQAATYFTRVDNGLSQPWHGSVWLNPPYSAPQAWIDKLFSELAAARCQQAIVLVNNATETAWFQRLLTESKLVCFPARRLAFWRHDHSNVGARQGQALFYFGNRADQFYSAFSATGAVLRRLSK